MVLYWFPHCSSVRQCTAKPPPVFVQLYDVICAWGVPQVQAVIETVAAQGVKAYLLNQVGFENGQYGKKCAYGHPGSQIDAAMAKNGSAFIKATMGW